MEEGSEAESERKEKKGQKKKAVCSHSRIGVSDDIG